MKNNSFTRLAFGLLLCCISISMQAQTKSVTVGTLKSGIATLTDQTGAENALKANLPDNASVSEVKLEYSQYDAAYFLTAKVSNNAISSIGIKLNQNGTTLLAVAGPGVEITCNGYKCAECRLQFSHWAPRCECRDSNKDADTRCDMSSRITISL
jgi:hypothetical protein